MAVQKRETLSAERRSPQIKGEIRTRNFWKFGEVAQKFRIERDRSVGPHSRRIASEVPSQNYLFKFFIHIYTLLKRLCV